PPYRLLCRHLRRRPGHSRLRQSLRPFIATWKSKRPSPHLGASQEAALSSSRIHSCLPIAFRSYWRRPETTYRRSPPYLPLPETEVCSTTESTGQTSCVVPPPMSIAFCAVRSRRTCPFSFRQNLRWSSTSRLPRRLALRYLNRFSCVPTR